MCKHPRMQSTVRIDHCPDCGYTFYYGDAHSADFEARNSELLCQGDPEQEPEPYLDQYYNDLYHDNE